MLKAIKLMKKVKKNINVVIPVNREAAQEPTSTQRGIHVIDLRRGRKFGLKRKTKRN